MKKYILPIFTILFISGCSNPPKEESSRMTLGLVQSVVEKGVNQTEIIKTLGAPILYLKISKVVRPGLMTGYHKKV